MSVQISRFALVAVLAFAGLAEATQTQTRLVTLPPAGISSSYPFIFEARVKFFGLACNPGASALPGGNLEMSDNGLLVRRKAIAAYSFSFCDQDGSFSPGTLLEFVPSMSFGTHVIDVVYSGSGAYERSSTQFTISVLPGFSGAASPEYGTVTAGVMGFGQALFCTLQHGAMVTPAGIPVAQPPAGDVVFPDGFFAYQIGDCHDTANFTVVPPNSRPRLRLLLLEFSSPIPPDATFWMHGPTPEESAPSWHQVFPQVSGRKALFAVYANADSPTVPFYQQVTSGVIGLAVPKSPTLSLLPEGLWWGGPTENGWGMSIARQGTMLFNTFFVYDASGTPQWVVMPGGTWNASFTSFTGNLYIPTGSWFGAYDVSRFSSGIPVGTATFTFSEEHAGTVSYSIAGVSATKSIMRQMFGAGAAPATNYTGLWWGGTFQRGWGLSITQQAGTLFAVLHTYDHDGTVTWFVMSAGSWTAANTYSGPLYRTHGSAWMGAAYDAKALRVDPVGTMTLTFDAQGNAMLSYVVDGIAASSFIERQPF